MEDPVKEIPIVIHGLTTTTTLNHQSHILDTYFLPNAVFDHPLCRVDSSVVSLFLGKFESREFIRSIYRWYKLLSPVIRLRIHSIAFDDKFSKYLETLEEESEREREREEENGIKESQSNLSSPALSPLSPPSPRRRPPQQQQQRQQPSHPSNEFSKSRPIPVTDITSPKESIYMDPEKYSRLYCDLTQVFTYWFLPFRSIEMGLVVDLFLEGRLVEFKNGQEIKQYITDEEIINRLAIASEQGEKTTTASTTEGTELKKKYWIARQVDLFPPDQWVKFVFPIPGARAIVRLATRLCTLLCFFGSILGYLTGKYKGPEREECPDCRELKERQTWVVKDDLSLKQNV